MEPTPSPTDSRRAYVVVELDGRLAWWLPSGVFGGDPALVAHADEAADGHYRVEWGRLPAPLTAGRRTAIAALTALMYEHPGRTRIVRWPDQVRDWWVENTYECAGDSYDHEPEPSR